VDGIARRLASIPGQPPVYAYLFSWGAPDASGKSAMPGDSGRRLGAFHSLEIPFFHGIDTVFSGLLDGALLSPANKPGRAALSAAMMDYVASFVRTGDPNREGSGLPRWEAWSNEPAGPRTLLLDADNDGLRVVMGSEEVTLESIREEMKAKLSGAVYEKAADYVNRWGVFSR
jgi:para-nitrobenzyl esterase